MILALTSKTSSSHSHSFSPAHRAQVVDGIVEAAELGRAEVGPHPSEQAQGETP
jgi:hypothetical protein